MDPLRVSNSGIWRCDILSHDTEVAEFQGGDCLILAKKEKNFGPGGNTRHPVTVETWIHILSRTLTRISTNRGEVVAVDEQVFENSDVQV